MSIGSNLIAARKAKGFTQEQLAERLGVSFQAVSAWERDAYLPEAGKLAALASALNISADLLLCGERDRAGLTRRYNRRWSEETGIPLVWLQSAGHNSNTDVPDQVNSIIQGFLREHGL